MKIYIYESNGFTNENKFAQYLIRQKIKGLGTYQDCLDWIVYASYINVDINTTTNISYGIVSIDNEKFYFYNYYEFEDYIKSNQFDSYIWYPNIIII